MAMPPSDDTRPSRFARWSKAKQESREAIDAPLPEQEPEPEPEVPGAPEPDAEELARNLAQAEAVDLTTLNPQSDMAVFFRQGVPLALRSKAMAALWRSDPVFANVDGLVDYGQDFGDPKLIMKTFTSAWQAGRGYLKETLDDALKPEEGDLPTAAQDPDQDAASEEDVAAANAPETPKTDDTPDPQTHPQPHPQTVKAAPEPSPAWPDLPEPGQETSPAPVRVSLRRRLDLEG